MLRHNHALLLLLVVCLIAGTMAQPASAQFRVDSFTTSNGLPQNTVSAIDVDFLSQAGDECLGASPP
jgi:hypothetical protein